MGQLSKVQIEKRRKIPRILNDCLNIDKSNMYQIERQRVLRRATSSLVNAMKKLFMPFFAKH